MSRIGARANAVPYQARRAVNPNPLTLLSWKAAYWADDPSWSNPGNGNAVPSWRDGSGNGYDVASSGSARPTFRSSVTNLNGKAGVEFDGTSDYLLNASPVVTQAYSLVAVVDMIAITGTPIISDAGGTGRAALFINAGLTWSVYTGTSVLSTSYGPSTGAHGFRVLANNASSALNDNMRNTAGTLGSATGFTGITLGAVTGGASNWGNVRIGFWGCYQGDITGNAAWPDLVSALAYLYGVNVA